MRTTSGTGSRAIWPLAAVCCLGLLLFLITATIVLALIPVYLSTRTVSPAANSNSANQPFYLQYSAAADDTNSLSGDVTNLDMVSKSLGLPAGVSLVGGTTDASGVVRRKRSVSHRRRKRDLTINILFTCIFVGERCNQKCLRERKQFKTDIQQRTTISAVPISIDPGALDVVGSYTFNLTFVGLATRRPSGFLGAPKSAVFVAIQSGLFTDPSTWTDGIVPQGPCSVLIPAGLVVTLAKAGLSIRMRLITIFGTLRLGSGSSTFTIRNSVNIIVRNGGKIEDLTTSKRFLLRRGSIVTIFPGGGFAAAGTTLQAYSPGGLGSSFTVTSTSGPLTCGILSDGTLLSFNKITFIAIRTGGLTSAATYLGVVGPSAVDCASSGCGVYITPGITVTTAELKGQLDINIDTMTITSGATCDLGTSGSSSEFKFTFPISIIVRSGGKLQDSTTSKRLLLPRSSIITVFSGGSCATVGTVLQAYSSTGLDGSFTVTSISGPFTFAILPSGIILNYNKIQFIAIRSGGFTSALTYLNGFAPSVEDCASSGCGVYIAGGVTLSTADLNGQLDINIDSVIVAVGAIFQLGTPGSASGFKFKFPISLDVSGGLSFVGSGGGIFLAVGSALNLLGGGTFSSLVDTFIQVYNPLTGVLIGAVFSLGRSLLGPYFITISATGSISFSTIGPGMSDTTTAMGVTVILG